MKTNNSNYEYLVLENLISKLSKQYDSLYNTTIENQFFIYRPINRKEYKNILNADIDDLEKQDEMVRTCLLYPEDYDLNNCLGGIPEKLYQEIKDKSYLSVEDMIMLIEMNKDEMELLDNQMTCLISAAFPSYKLEDIEKLDMIQFIKLYTRAEWILTNLKDMTINEDVIDILKQSINSNTEENEIEENNDLNVSNDENTHTSKRPRMTPEQIKEYKEFCKKFPEFNMATDYGFTGDIGPSYHKEPPAMRPGWGIPKKTIK